MLCGECSLVNHRIGLTTVTPLRCKCWSCDECRPRRKRQLIREVKLGRPNSLITLTSQRKPGGCPDAAARALALAWRKVRREFVEKSGPGSMPFLAVFEATKHGWPHLHIVARVKWLDQGWLSDRMRFHTGAPIVDVRRVKGVRGVAAYIAKYLGKKPHRFDGTKRYWRSLDWLDPVRALVDGFKDDTGEWHVLRERWDVFARRLERAGLPVAWGLDRAVVSDPDPP